MKMKLTWEDVLRDKKYNRSISGLAKIASNLGYEYFCFNSIIYSVEEESGVELGKDSGMTIADIAGIPKPKSKETIVLAGHTMGGEPTMLRYQVECTDQEHENGTHYDMAIDMAEEEGFERPFICFDSTEISEVISMGKELDNL